MRDLPRTVRPTPVREIMDAQTGDCPHWDGTQLQTPAIRLPRVGASVFTISGRVADSVVLPLRMSGAFQQCTGRVPAQKTGQLRGGGAVGRAYRRCAFRIMVHPRRSTPGIRGSVRPIANGGPVDGKPALRLSRLNVGFLSALSAPGWRARPTGLFVKYGSQARQRESRLFRSSQGDG